MWNSFRALIMAAMAFAFAPRMAWPRDVDFGRDVAPLFERHCVKCHGPAKQQGGLRFDSRRSALGKGDSGDPAVAPGRSADSQLLQRVASTDEFIRMPPEGDRLSAAEIDLLKRWIDAGAEWPEQEAAAPLRTGELVVTEEDRRHWSFRPLRRPATPEIRSREVARTSIDAFVLAALEAKGLDLSPRASPRTLVRRIKMDLVGLPPTPEEFAAFEREFESDPEATEKLLDSFLNSIHYGERWGRHWLDVARYADSHGQEGDQDRPHAYRYRDFVIQAWNEDMPFDQFARWQIAGNELEPENPLAVAATGFLAAGPSTELKAEPMEKEKALGRFIERMRNRYNELDDVISTFGTGMLGLTLGCARCHDHKYDAIPTRDYYSLLSAFHSGDRGNVFLGKHDEVAAYEKVHSTWSGEHDAAVRKRDRWLVERRRGLEAEVVKGRIAARNLRADATFDLVREVTSKGAKSARAKALAAEHAISLKMSEEDLAAAMPADERERWNELTAAVREIETRRPQPLPEAFVYRDETDQPRETWLFPRGDFQTQGDAVELGFLTVLTKSKSAGEYWQVARAEPFTIKSTYQRAAVAGWLTDVDEGAGALLARVIVNRVWQHHFGKGLVRTSDDFGVQGERPTHPELLEWLAADFVEHGWRIKRLHRLIMSSAVYRQDVAFDEASASVDPDNRLLWRREPMRLEAEALRDSILFAAGTLNLKPYGPGFKPPIPKDVMVARNLQSPYHAERADSPNVLRRSVYMFHKRVIPQPLMELFDRPTPSQSCGCRQETLVAPQALALLNDPFVRSQAEAFARRLVRERPETSSRVQFAFETSLGRRPGEAELAAAHEFLRSQQSERERRDSAAESADAYRAALADYCQTLFGLNEFLYVD